MFQKLFVDKLRWCTYWVFTELLMLGQCMPGGQGVRWVRWAMACGLPKQYVSNGLPMLRQGMPGGSEACFLVHPTTPDSCHRPCPPSLFPHAGPTSTQMGFAIGVLKKGLSGGLLSGALFQVR